MVVLSIISVKSDSRDLLAVLRRNTSQGWHEGSLAEEFSTPGIASKGSVLHRRIHYYLAFIGHCICSLKSTPRTSSSRGPYYLQCWKISAFLRRYSCIALREFTPWGLSKYLASYNEIHYYICRKSPSGRLKYVGRGAETVSRRRRRRWEHEGFTFASSTSGKEQEPSYRGFSFSQCGAASCMRPPECDGAVSVKLHYREC